MSVKTICICASEAPFVRGGAEIQLESLARELTKRGYEVARVTIPFVTLPIRDLLKNALIWRWIELEKTTHVPIDLVICSKFPSYAVQHPRKVTWLIHQFRQVYELHGTEYSPFTTHPDDEAVRQSIINFDTCTLSESKAIFTESQRVADRLKRYNGLDAKPLYHPPLLWDDLYFASYGDYILSVGRLVPLKRVDLLIRALAQINDRAIIVGEGPERDNLERMSEKLGVADRVRFVGAKWGEELVELYANARAVYYAPFDEDFGLVTPEAFRACKPVLTASDSGGTLEWVEDGVNGFVHEPEPTALASAIAQLDNNDALCRRMGENGRDKVAFLTWDYVIENLVNSI
jgi:glycosyltransferase involved in cell wall biosynthesis